MKQRTYRAYSPEELDQVIARIKREVVLSSPERTLILAHETRPNTDLIRQDLATLGKEFPGYQIIGATMMGPTMIGVSVSSIEVVEGLELSVITFESSSFTVLRYDCTKMSSPQAGRLFAKDLAEVEDAKGVFLICGGAGISPDAFLVQLDTSLGSIPIFGTQSGVWDSYGNKDQLVFVDGIAKEDLFVAVVLQGRDLHVQTGSSFGWRPVGKEMRVTAGTAGGYVAEIDHVRPMDLYKRYLHIDSSQPDFADCCSFPIVFKEGDDLIARIPLPNGDKGLYLGASSPVGLHASLAYAREKDLLQDSLDLANELAQFQPQALWGVFCPNRRVFLGNSLADREIGYFRQVCPGLITSCGYCEILFVNGRGTTRNSTAVLVGLREGDPTQRKPNRIDDPGISHAASPNTHLGGMLVSLLEESTKDLQEAAFVDGMTGLPNRAALEHWVTDVSQRLNPGQPITAILFDIDNFKSINDSYGHDVGDTALCKIADAASSFSGEHAIMGRWGGDEFLGITVEANEVEVAQVFDDMRGRLSMMDFGPIGHVTLSAGISSMEAQVDSFTNLYKRIDRAMYHSKHMGGNQASIYTNAYRDEINAPADRISLDIHTRSMYERSPFPIMIFRLSSDGFRPTLLSDGYCKMVGSSREGMLKYLRSRKLTRIHPADASRLPDFMDNLTEGKPDSIIFRMLIGEDYHSLLATAVAQGFPDGTRLTVVYYIDLTSASDAIGDVASTNGAPTSAQAATERDGAKTLYRFSPEARATLESLRFPLSVLQRTDDRYQAVLVSDGACNLFGETRSSLIRYLSNKSYRKMHPDDAGKLIAAASNFANTPDQSLVCRMLIRGSYHPILFVQKRHFMEDGTPLFFITYTDLEETAASAEEGTKSYLTAQKDYLTQDPITGLPNGRYFDSFAQGTIREMFARKTKPSAVFFNVREMRSYNDLNGYGRGNELLRLIGQSISESFDQHDLIVRQGDDHFVVITRTQDVEDRVLRANQLLAQKANVDRERLAAGIYHIKEPDEDATAAVDKARLAVGFIRDNLQVQVRVYDQMVSDYYRYRDYVLTHWREAIKKDWIKIYYQPVLDVLSNKVVSLEALARWVDPQLGVISPGTFVPVLEDRQLMWEMDLHILRLVCTHLGRRLRLGKDIIPVSVNISRNDLSVPDLHERIKEAIEENGLSPRDVAIEITESALLDHEDIIHEHLRLFHEAGHRVYLDDFGSGYSSFNTAQEFDFDVLKMDLMFLRAANEKTPVILTNIVDMAKRLGMTPLMEGVETEAELDFLREIGCTLVQGYLISKPHPVGSMDKILPERGIEPASPEERDFYAETARVNILDATTVSESRIAPPLRDENPVFIFLRQGDDICILYSNEAARSVDSLAREHGMEVLEQAITSGGNYHEVITEVMDEAQRTGKEVHHELDTPKLKSRLTFRLISSHGELSSYLVVASDTYLPLMPNQDKLVSSHWNRVS